MTTYRLMDGLSGRPGNGPSTPASYSGGPFLAGTVFNVTSWGLWLEGYWWWVCNTGQSTAAQKFALWSLYTTTTSEPASLGVIAGGTVTSGGLTAGQWNYTPLAVPIALSAKVAYIAATGWDTTGTTGFPVLNNQFGAAQPYAAGITNGPLMAYSDVVGSAPSPNNWSPQGLFGTAGSDPSVNMPAVGSNSANFWVDVQVSDQAPAGAAYRLRPGVTTPPNMFSDTPTPFTLGTEFTISTSCSYRHWFYSPPGATVLPTQAAIYNQTTEVIVPGTLNNAPSWSGIAGSGWVSCAGTVVLPPGSYRVAVCSGPTSTVWNNAVNSYWGGGGPASSGITTGPLSAPSEASAGSPGQASYNAGSTIAWPGTYNTPGNGSDYLVDVEVTPTSGTTSGAMMASSII